MGNCKYCDITKKVYLESDFVQEPGEFQVIVKKRINKSSYYETLDICPDLMTKLLDIVQTASEQGKKAEISSYLPTSAPEPTIRHSAQSPENGQISKSDTDSVPVPKKNESKEVKKPYKRKNYGKRGSYNKKDGPYQPDIRNPEMKAFMMPIIEKAKKEGASDLQAYERARKRWVKHKKQQQNQNSCTDNEKELTLTMQASAPKPVYEIGMPVEKSSKKVSLDKEITSLENVKDVAPEPKKAPKETIIGMGDAFILTKPKKVPPSPPKRCPDCGLPLKNDQDECPDCAKIVKKKIDEVF